jgi:hypothetical protein
MRRAAKKRAEVVQKVLSELPLPTRKFPPIPSMTNGRKAPAIHETHKQCSKLPKLTPMDLCRMKVGKDALGGQDLVMSRQRQSEQVRQNILMQEQTQRVATFPVHNLLLSIGPTLIVLQTTPAQRLEP